MKAIIALLFLASTLAAPPTGLSHHKNNVRIMNGQQAEPKQFPFVAFIYADSTLCAGALISDQWVLTSATCAEYVEEFIVHLGAITVTFEDPARVIKFGRLAVIHPSYNNHWHNLGLIKLESPVEFTDYIQPITLYQGDYLLTDVKLTVMGWGEFDEDEVNLANYLQYGNLTSLDNDSCNEILGDVNKESMCVSGEGGATPCWTDRGAPVMMIDSDGNTVLAGIFNYHDYVLWCVGDTDDYPIIITRIEEYVPWIKETTGIL